MCPCSQHRSSPSSYSRQETNEHRKELLGGPEAALPLPWPGRTSSSSRSQAADHCALTLRCPDPFPFPAALPKSPKWQTPVPNPSPRGAVALRAVPNGAASSSRYRRRDPCFGALAQARVWVRTQAAPGSGSGSSVFCPGSGRSAGCSPDGHGICPGGHHCCRGPARPGSVEGGEYYTGARKALRVSQGRHAENSARVV